MKRLFVDSFYYIALINPQDAYHQRARALVPALVGERFWTTDLVIMEVANALAKKPARRYVTDYIRALEQSSDTTIVRLTTELLTRALDSYKQHHDKAWSLTDCLSFLVMQEHSLSEALTGDHHFEQAGFRPLFTGGSTP